MKVLVLSFYYEPDLCAGSFRCKALIDKLKLIPEVEIEVVTTLPNRYSNYSAEAKLEEKVDNVLIKRVELPNHDSGMKDQIKAFYTYQNAALKFVKHRNYDLVFATSSRLFTAFLGARISNAKKLPLYLDIRDIFVDTIGDVLPAWLAKPLLPMLRLIENYTFSKASHINLVSKGFEQYFKQRLPKARYSYFTNGIDGEFVEKTKPKNRGNSDVVQVLYAGNIGEGQGLHKIIPNLAKAAGSNYEFVIVGGGGRKSQLEQSVAEIPNVYMKSPVKRKDLKALYDEADVLFLHLNDYPAFEKVLPSKVFEYAASGKPILAGVGGYASKFISNEIVGAKVFKPCDEKSAYHMLKNLDIKSVDRSAFVNKYRRESVMNEMAASLLAMDGIK